MPSWPAEICICPTCNGPGYGLPQLQQANTLMCPFLRRGPMDLQRGAFKLHANMQSTTRAWMMCECWQRHQKVERQIFYPTKPCDHRLRGARRQHGPN